MTQILTKEVVVKLDLLGYQSSKAWLAEWLKVREMLDKAKESNDRPNKTHPA